MLYTLHENKLVKWRTNRHQDNKLKYSSLVWRTLLSKIIKECGVHILFQFGFESQIINRMITQWVLGGEVDILSQIYSNKDKFKAKFIYAWEYNLFKQIYSTRKTYFHSKPIAMLANYSSYKFRSRYVNRIVNEQMDYDTFIFYNFQDTIDRTIIYDPLIYFIIELYKYYEIDKESLNILFTTDFSLYNHKDLTSIKLYYYYFKDMKNDDEVKTLSTYIQKKSWAVELIPILYKLIRDEYNKQMITNIQNTCIDNTWVIVTEYHNHKFVNFAWHYKIQWSKYGSSHIPCIFLQQLRDKFYELTKHRNVW